MKDEDSNPLEPVGDEPIEARIVAWVLGDASAFEAAELERLCEEQPELQVFRERMQALHGLLADAEHAPSDAAWKLPSEKRAKLEALFNSSAVATEPVATVLKPKRSFQPWIRQALLASAACIVLAGGFYGVITPMSGGDRVARQEESRQMAIILREDSIPRSPLAPMPRAEGYASAAPVLPEIAASDLEFRSGGGGGMGGAGLAAGAGDERFESKSEVSKNLAGNGRARLKVSPAKPAITAPATPPAIASADDAIRPQDFNSTLAGAGRGVASPASRPSSEVVTGKKSEGDGPDAAIADADGSAVVTGGLRSAKDTVNRNSIDAVMNNPTRVPTQAPAPASLHTAATDRYESGSRFQAAAGEKGDKVASGPYAGSLADRGSFADGQLPPIEGADSFAANSSEARGGKREAGQNYYLHGSAGKDGPSAVAEQEMPVDAAKPSESQNALVGKAQIPEVAIKAKAAAGQSEPGEARRDAERRQLDETQPNVDEVRRTLYRAEGNFNLGKYDDAKKEIEQALRIDPNNSAAQRWGERVASAKSDYLRSANDHTRAELLAQVDKAWELPIPEAQAPASLEDLRKAVREQEARVAQAQNSPIGKTLAEGIDPRDSGAHPPNEMAGSLAQEKIRLESQLSDLSKLGLERDELSYASGLDLPDGPIKELYPKYLEQQRNLGALQARGLGDQHPTVIAEKAETEKTKAQLVKGMKESLESKLALTKDSLAKIDPLEGLKKNTAVVDAITAEEYLAVVNQYEASARELQRMKAEAAGVAVSEEQQKLITDQENKVGERLKLLATVGKRYGIAPHKLFAEQAKLEALKQRLAAAERKTTVVPADETSATEEPFSTFSLHVSDASFKLAKAALDRGERLSADQIRVEEFYNAFDYGDAAPAPGEAVACAIEQGGHPILPQRNLVRVAMRVGSTGRAEGQPLNLTVLLDNSGSMEREDRSAGLKAAVGQLASLLKAGDSVTLAGFSRTPHLLADRLPGDQAAKLVELVDGLPSAGGTNLEEALKLAGELAVQRKNPAAQNRIVLLTDGAANLGNAKPEELAEKIAALRQQGIAFDAAGIGAGGVNDRMLEALTRNGNGRYYIVNDASDADANFARQLAGAFRPAAENVKVQVRFNPERVSRYKLIGFEKHRLNKEDFHNDSVDAAEMAADEAGVALYQVEVLPQGTGEIGEVSVRFRDAAAGQMVERSWTIQHDAKAQSFDQASPSLQLAGLSMLAAEKLRGGPMADATDFSSLAPQIARVRAYYGTSSRVGELVGMTGKLK